MNNKPDMGTILFAIFCIALFIIFLSSALMARGSDVYVHDGDTITVNGERVRLLGVDAPERGQAHGDVSTRWLTTKVRGGNIRIERRGKDRYDRTIGIVYQGRTSLNRELVRAGMAHAYVQYSDLYVDAQDEAYKARRGIWADPTCPPLAPLLWRKGYR